MILEKNLTFIFHTSIHFVDPGWSAEDFGILPSALCFPLMTLFWELRCVLELPVNEKHQKRRDVFESDTVNLPSSSQEKHVNSLPWWWDISVAHCLPLRHARCLCCSLSLCISSPVSPPSSPAFFHTPLSLLYILPLIHPKPYILQILFEEGFVQYTYIFLKNGQNAPSKQAFTLVVKEMRVWLHYFKSSL